MKNSSINTKPHFPCLEHDIRGFANQIKVWEITEDEAGMLNELISCYRAALYALDVDNPRNHWRKRFKAEDIYEELKNTRP